MSVTEKSADEIIKNIGNTVGFSLTRSEKILYYDPQEWYKYVNTPIHTEYVKEDGKIVGLRLDHCNIHSLENIPHLKELKDLKHLSLQHNNISNISCLDNLEDLKILSLHYNKITKIKGLNQLKNLEILDLSWNFIDEIQGFQKLGKLQLLNLNVNQLTEIKHLDNLLNLSVLHLENHYWNAHIKDIPKQGYELNNISKLQGLEKLMNLEMLDLRGNPIKKIEGLENLRKLHTLLISNIKIDKSPELLKYWRENNDWTPEDTWNRLQSGEELRFVDLNHPDKKLYFPNLYMLNEIELKKYLDWSVTIIIEKLMQNEFPSDYDLNHYLFLKNWRDIEQTIINKRIENEATKQFLEYLESIFSIELSNGFKILL